MDDIQLKELLRKMVSQKENEFLEFKHNFLPEEEALAMETYNTWVRLFELQRYYSWIIDRFHISVLLSKYK